MRRLISKLSSSSSKQRTKERLKKEHYLKNGSAVLEEFLALCDGNCRIPLRYFTAIEIERATKDAENKLVFISGRYMVKGLLDKRRVLVYFTKSYRYLKDICRDIAVTSQMSHLKNVLKLIGYCLEYAQPVMVYEYVEEPITLHDLLFNNRNSSLPWGSRLRIANEIASALVYLHSEFKTPIIFTDLNSRKVLIDQSSGVSKLFDFSQSVSLPPGKLEVHAPSYVSEIGDLIDQEYYLSGFASQKTDVYGFGNILLQLLTGKIMYVYDGGIINLEGTDLEFNIEECNVIDIADSAILVEERGIHEIRQQLKDCFNLGKRCIASKGEDRPYIIYVARELRRIEKYFCALSTLAPN